MFLKIKLRKEKCENTAFAQINMKYVHNNHGVCSRCVYFNLENGKVSDVSFDGGCNGNLKAISKLVEGQDAQHIIDILKGNDCGGRGTSCADQFAKGLEEALEKERQNA